MSTKLTAKRTKSVNSRSHALNATKRKQKVNLQNIIINGVKIKTSAREARTLKKSI